MTIQFAPIWDNAALAFSAIRANATDTASANTSTLLELSVNGNPRFVVDKFGELIITPPARTSGSDSLISLIAPVDTTRAASTEATDINFNLARTVQFAAGNITNQRAIRIQAPTYSFASASTITTASTLSISGPPDAGTNATLTNRWALNVESGDIRLSSNAAVVWPNGSSIRDNSPTGFGLTITPPTTVPFITLFANAMIRGFYTNHTLEIGHSTAQVYYSTSNHTPDIDTNRIVVRASDGLHVRHSSPTSSGKLLTYNTFTDNSNYERLALQFGTFSSARYAQLATESAGTGTANINLVMTPRGTGAFIVGPPPDGTTTGGNARGANSVDFQTSRTAASQVCSSSYSIIAGQNNTSTGSGWDAVFGLGNTSTNGLSLVAGGGNSTTGYSTICLGAFCSVTASEGAAAIGRQVNISGTYGFGANYQTSVEGAAGAAFGDNSKSRLWSEFAHASGRFSTNGDCQRVAIILRGKTTTNAAVELVDPTRFVIPAGFVFHGILKISGSKSNASLISVYCRKVSIKRVGNVTTLLQVETVGTDYEDDVNTNVIITADDTNKALKIEVVGITGETWRWQAVIEGGLYAYGT